MTSLRELEVRHLVAFEAVARLGTMARAADEVGYTQGAVSQQIARLEKVVGEPVFDRHPGPRPVSLTPFGERVLDHACDLLDRVRSTAADLDAYRDGDAGRIRIGTFQSASVALLPQVVGRLLAERPGIELELFEAMDDHLTDWLRSSRIDLSFFIGENGEPGEFRTVPLLADRYVAVSRTGDLRPGALRPKELVALRLMADPTDARHRIDPGLRAAGVVPTYAFQSRDYGTALALVRAGLGVAIVPQLILDPQARDLAVHEIDADIPARELALGWRADRTLSPAAQHFVDAALDAVAAGDLALPVTPN